MITQTRLKHLFGYDETTGRLIRKIFEKTGEKDLTEGVSAQGYFMRWVDGICYTEHSLVFLFHFNYIPDEIDHRNRVKTDNRIDNLRECSRTKNNGNHRKTTRPTSSRFKGVYWSKNAKKWIAQISMGKTYHYLGLFREEVHAAAAYNGAAVLLFGEFAHLNEVTL